MENNNKNLKELREFVKNKGFTKDFKEKTGQYLSKCNKKQLESYINSLNHPPIIKKIPKIKNFKPDQKKLIDIRKEIDDNNIPNIEKENEIKERFRENMETETGFSLDNEEIDILDNIVEEPINNENNIDKINESNNSSVPTEYIYNENYEIKCSRLAELYPSLKNINDSKGFTSSEEKYIYIENYINRSKSGTNISNYFFMVSSYLESNEIINNYVKLEGYTNQLLKRKEEIEVCIEELRIKYMDEIGDSLTMSVEARFGLIFLETALATHMNNLAILNNRKDKMRKEMEKKENIN